MQMEKQDKFKSIAQSDLAVCDRAGTGTNM